MPVIFGQGNNPPDIPPNPPFIPPDVGVTVGGLYKNIVANFVKSVIVDGGFSFTNYTKIQRVITAGTIAQGAAAVDVDIDPSGIPNFDTRAKGLILLSDVTLPAGLAAVCSSRATFTELVGNNDPKIFTKTQPALATIAAETTDFFYLRLRPDFFFHNKFEYFSTNPGSQMSYSVKLVAYVL